MTACFAPSPSDTGSRRPDGQGLPLSRTMLSNHELPYVGRFACDWLRLATTDPDTIHDASVRPPARYVSGPTDGLVRWGIGPRDGAGRGRRGQVPVCQEPRYSSWAGVSRSMSTPIVSSLRRAI